MCAARSSGITAYPKRAKFLATLSPRVSPLRTEAARTSPNGRPMATRNTLVNASTWLPSSMLRKEAMSDPQKPSMVTFCTSTIPTRPAARTASGELRPGDEPQLTGGRAGQQADRAALAALDACRAQIAVGHAGHRARRLEHGAAGDAVAARVAVLVATRGADLRGGTKLDPGGARVVAGQAAQEAQVAAPGAALEQHAGDHHAHHEQPQQIAGAARRLDNAEGVVAPGDQQEDRVDD